MSTLEDNVLRRWNIAPVSRHVLACAVLTVVTAYVYAALFSQTGFKSHEGAGLYLRPVHYLAEFAAGNIPPRLFGAEIGGAGYAFPLFYPPLSAWLAAGLQALTGDLILGTHAALFCSIWLSGLACYAAAVWLGASSWLALAVSTVYIVAPYRITNVFVRGALAESSAFVWYPLIIAAAYRMASRRVFSVVLPLAVAGLLLTHTVMGLFFALMAAPFLLYMAVRLGPRSILGVVMGIAAGGALSAWHLLPVRVYSSQVRVGYPENMWATDSDVSRHAITQAQLVTADPARWYGLSPTHMSFHLGLVAAITGVAFLVFLLHGKRTEEREPHYAGAAVLSFVVAEVCAVIALYPRPFFRVLPDAFGYVQFPWRLLGLFLVFLCFSAIFAGSARHLPRRAHVLFACAALLGATLTPKWERTAQYEAGWVGTDTSIIEEAGFIGPGMTVLAEYLPAGVPLPTIGAALSRAPDFQRGQGNVVAIPGDDGMRLRGTVDEPSVVRLRLISYPLYRATDSRGETIRMGSSDGLVTLALPPGPVDLTVRRSTPLPAQLGAAISALTLMLLLSVSVAPTKAAQVAKLVIRPSSDG